MTSPAHALAPSDTLSFARETMHDRAVRHLPVVERGRLVGLVTLSDLYAAEAILAADPDATEVAGLMARDLYTVPPSTPLAEVAGQMARRHLGSVLVVDADERLLGLFTTSDACRELARLLGPEAP
jgi:acetoin utilization protein AcuB